MRLLLDTAVLIFAAEAPEPLSRRAATAIENPDNILELSPVSITEIAIKAALGKLKLCASILRLAVENLGVRILPYTAEHAFCLFDLPKHHADPFDRQIIAQALSEKIPVITPDEMFAHYKGLNIVWR